MMMMMMAVQDDDDDDDCQHGELSEYPQERRASGAYEASCTCVDPVTKDKNEMSCSLSPLVISCVCSDQ